MIANFEYYIFYDTLGMEVDTLEVVQKVLQNAQTDSSFKSTQVTKDIEVAIDVGNLLAVDRNPLDLQRFR